MSKVKQKTINNRQLFIASILVVVVVMGAGYAINLEKSPPLEKDTWGWYVFFFYAGLVFTFSMLAHLFYFSWLSAAPVQRPPRSSAEPLKRLLFPAAALHLLVIIPALVLFIWFLPGIRQNIIGVEVLWLLLFLLFGVGEMFLLGTRWFAPVFSACHFGWRLPGLMLSAAAVGGLATAAAMGFVAAGGI